MKKNGGEKTVVMKKMMSMLSDDNVYPDYECTIPPDPKDNADLREFDKVMEKSDLHTIDEDENWFYGEQYHPKVPANVNEFTLSYMNF